MLWPCSPYPLLLTDGSPEAVTTAYAVPAVMMTLTLAGLTAAGRRRAIGTG
ncbi:hypothetical protein ABZ924_20595 [Streptomyces sp. NPDC046876]|uniref:hypothetical protein n=1 Tax=Streptomyces sp. NPDC046876 TaxID=3155616 RepID=UPI0033E5318E